MSIDILNLFNAILWFSETGQEWKEYKSWIIKLMIWCVLRVISPVNIPSSDILHNATKGWKAHWVGLERIMSVLLVAAEIFSETVYIQSLPDFRVIWVAKDCCFIKCINKIQTPNWTKMMSYWQSMRHQSKSILPCNLLLATHHKCKVCWLPSPSKSIVLILNNSNHVSPQIILMSNKETFLLIK